MLIRHPLSVGRYLRDQASAHHGETTAGQERESERATAWRPVFDPEKLGARGTETGGAGWPGDRGSLASSTAGPRGTGSRNSSNGAPRGGRSRTPLAPAVTRARGGESGRTAARP